MYILRIHIYIHTCTYMHTYIHAYTHTYTCINIYIYIMYICVCIHIYIYTLTPCGSPGCRSQYVVPYAVPFGRYAVPYKQNYSKTIAKI